MNISLPGWFCLAAFESLRHLHPTASETTCSSLPSAELILIVELILLSCQEEDGSDSCVKTLRSCLQAVEQSGVVDFEIGGHEFERPAEVFAGEADDKLLDASKEKLKCHSDTFVVLFHTADRPQVQHSAKGRQSNVLESQCSAVEIPEAYQCCKLRVAPEFERFTCFANRILARISPTVCGSELNCNFALCSVVIKSCLRCGAWECTRQRAWSHRPNLCGCFAMDSLWTRELVSELCRSASVGLSWLRKLLIYIYNWHACQNWHVF